MKEKLKCGCGKTGRLIVACKTCCPSNCFPDYVPTTKAGDDALRKAKEGKWILDDAAMKEARAQAQEEGRRMERAKIKSIDKILYNAEKGVKKGKDGLELIKIGLLEIVDQEVRNSIKSNKQKTIDVIESREFSDRVLRRWKKGINCFKFFDVMKLELKTMLKEAKHER